MPVENRLDMELTGIKTPVGIKVQGPDLDEIQRIGREIEEMLTPVEGTRGVFAERVSQGFYVNVDVDRDAAARYGLTVGDVQTRDDLGRSGAKTSPPPSRGASDIRSTCAICRTIATISTRLRRC